jgi:diguanylate cyclase (GGDEF)-like protein
MVLSDPAGEAAADVPAMLGQVEVQPGPDPTGEDVAVAPAAPEPPARDLLPGLDDEAAWDRRIADENARVVRYRRPTTIVRIELDGLDRLTGQLGDEAGDRLLRAMADTLQRLARDTDHIAHLGQGVFGVLMPETPEDAAIVYVDRVSRACELWLESGAIAVRLAIGWASTSGEIGLDDVQRLAMERMQHGPWREARHESSAPAVAEEPPVEPPAEEPMASAEAARPPVAEAPPVEPPAEEPLASAEAARPPVAEEPLALTPALTWETCRDPNCNHKEDHRRDRRPRPTAG